MTRLAPAARIPAVAPPVAPPVATPIVEAVDVHRTFRSGVHALRGVSVAVATGELVGVQGPSGSGKSSLLHLLAGLDRPDTGTVSFEGRDLATVDDAARTAIRLRRIGLVLQSFDLLPTLDAADNVAVPAVLAGATPRAARARAVELLDAVGLADRAGHRPGELSGGEQQRACIARALMNDPVLVLADEPTAALDSVAGDGVLRVLQDVAADGRAVIVASHDARAIAHAHRSIRLVDGRVVDPPTLRA